MATLLASPGDSARWLRYQALAAAHAGDTATLTRLDRWSSIVIDRASGTPLAELLAERARVAALRGNGGEAIDLLRGIRTQQGVRRIRAHRPVAEDDLVGPTVRPSFGRRGRPIAMMIEPSFRPTAERS